MCHSNSTLAEYCASTWRNCMGMAMPMASSMRRSAPSLAGGLMDSGVRFQPRLRAISSIHRQSACQRCHSSSIISPPLP